MGTIAYVGEKAVIGGGASLSVTRGTSSSIIWRAAPAMESHSGSTSLQNACTDLYKITVPANAGSGAYTFNPELGYKLGGGDGNTEPIVQVANTTPVSGITREVNGNILPGVSITLDGISPVVSDQDGQYQVMATVTGNRNVVSRKDGFRDRTQTINIAGLGQGYAVTCNFQGQHGLIPNAPDIWYALDCVNRWLYPPNPDIGLDIWTALDVINAWLYPVTSTPTPTPIDISWESMGGPPGERINRLIQNQDGNHELYAITDGGHIYKSEDRGNTWQLVDSLDGIGATAIAVYENKLYVSSHTGVYCYDNSDTMSMILDQACNDVIISNNKIFPVFSQQHMLAPTILYADLISENLDWKDISPSAQELTDIRVPPNDSILWWQVSVRNIVAHDNRILANIVAEVEGTGASTNGGLYISEDLGDSWDRVNLDVPRDVIITNIIQDPENQEHIFLTFKHPIIHDYTYPVSELIRDSNDGGKTWDPVTDLPIASNGITDVVIRGSTKYLLNTFNSFILKLDGSSYEVLDMPIVPEFANIRFNLDIMIFDCDAPDIVYGKTGSVWATGLVKSEDNMETWHKMDRGINESSPSIVVPHPTDTNTVFTSGNVIQEKYCTRDWGETWEPFSPTAAGDELRIDPHNPNHLILIDEITNIYESFDCGRTFNVIAPTFSSAKVPALAISEDDPDKIYVSNVGVGISESQSSSGWRYMTNSPDYAYDIKIDPEDSGILYATYSPKIFENHSSIWRYSKYQQENLGWTEIFRLNNSRGITSLEIDESSPNTMYAGTIGEDGTIWVSNDRGNSWSKLNEDLSFTTIWGHSQLQIDPRDRNTVYAGTWGGGTFKTTNGGEDWVKLDENHTFSPTFLAISESNPNIIYACDRVNPIIHRSDDAGLTWHTYYDFGQEFMLTPAVAVDPNDPDIIYASAFKPPLAHRGALVKIEHGQVVADLGTELPRAVIEMEIDKENPEVLYVTTHIYGVYKSIDGGNTWQRLDDRGTGLPRTGIYDIDVDPMDNNILYATALCGALPDYMIRPGMENLEGKCGVYKSTDGGEHWNLILETISEARGIDIDPEDNRNLYVADMMGGVWVSNDAGQNWRQENNGLGSISMTSVKIMDEYIYASTQGSGVYSGVINLDRSITWDDSRSNKPKAYVSKILIRVDPKNSNRIYAAAYPGGLLRSDDGGKHWNDKNFLTPSIKVYDPSVQGYYTFDINPENTNIVWLGAYGKGMFVSYDGMDFDMFANGEDNIMAGKHITSVRINPNNPEEVYVGTQEGVFVTSDSGKHWAEMNNGLETLDVRSIRVERVEYPPFYDDFEDGDTQGWSFTDAAGQPSASGWSVVRDGGNYVLRGIGHNWANAGSSSWTNYTFTTKLKITGGGIHVNFRLCDNGRYFLGVGENGLYLNKQYDNWSKFAELGSTAWAPSLNQWHDLRIEAIGGNIKIYVDAVLRLEYTDVEPLLSGAIAFETLVDSPAIDSPAFVDDVRVVADPTECVYVGTAGYGVYRLDLSTMTWQNLGRTFGGGYWSAWERRMYQFSSLVFDPDVPGKLYYGTFPSGFFISEDNGHTWRDSSLGLGNDGIFSLKMDPYDHNILFAGTYNGVVKSSDGGMTWVMKSKGMPSEQWPYTIAIDDQNPNIMYVSTKNGQNKGFCQRNSFCGVVMKSTDGGESWFKIMNGLDDRSEFYSLLIYPHNHNILFLSTNWGVYTSSDAGNSWQAANTGLPSTDNQVRDNVADNLALSSDNRYLILGLANHGVWMADISKLNSSP
jgi:photosystem II stability/assembly factor-like uncharacterized protein